jgi:hypothetical protein
MPSDDRPFGAPRRTTRAGGGGRRPAPRLLRAASQLPDPSGGTKSFADDLTTDWWNVILETIAGLRIYMNLSFYLFFSTGMFLVWAWSTFVMVRFDYRPAW